MKLTDRVRLNLARFLYKVADARVGPLRLVPTWLRHSFFIPTWRNLIQEGYKQNSAVMACATALAFAFQEPDIRVIETDGEGMQKIVPGSLVELLKSPNPQLGLDEFLKYAIIYCSTGGNFYGWIQRNGLGIPIAIWPFSDGQITPVAGQTTADGIVGYYLYDPTGLEADQRRIEPEDMIHWQWMVDPLQPWRGIGAIASAAAEIDTDSESTGYLFSLLKNDAVPRTIVTMSQGVELGLDKIKRLRHQWDDLFGGSKRGGVGFMEHGESVERIGFNLAELAFEQIKAVPEARIAATFRVPAIIAGLNIGLARSTYSNFSEARVSWTEDTLVKLWKGLASELTQKLADPGQVIEFDLRTVAALGEQRRKVAEQARADFNAGMITRGESRALLGLLVQPNDDVFYIPFSIIVVPRDEAASSFDQPGDDEGGEDPDEDPESSSANNAMITKTAEAWWGVKEDMRQIWEDTKVDFKSAHLKRGTTKQRRRAQTAMAEALQRIRRSIAGRYQSALSKYFTGQAQRVTSRLAAFNAGQSAADEDLETKQGGRLPTIDDLWLDSDDAELINLSRQFTSELFIASNPIYDASLGATIDFDLTDPGITKLLLDAGTRIVAINETTRQSVVDILQQGNEAGASIDELARGFTFTDADGKEVEVAGIGSTVKQTYKNRDRAIARTELGTSQNEQAGVRFQEAGVPKVFVLDNQLEDSDPVCTAIDGAIRSIEWMLDPAPADPDGLAIQNPLQHPNCVRAFAPEF